MLIVALQHCGFDPSFAVGGDLGEAGTNAHHGSGTCFVAEADESDGSLLEYTPDVAVVTNIEADHLDFFGTPDAYRAIFDQFVERLAPGGVLIVCADDEGAAALADRSAEQGIRVLRYGSGEDGEPGPGLAGTLLSWDQQGTSAVAHIALAGEPHPRVMRLAVPGRHMALNALAALLAAIEAGAPVDDVLDGLAGFDGVRRRFELVGTVNGVRVFDDYAHHPTKVRAALSALRTLARQGESTHAGAGRAVVVFQPHLYSRTQTFAREFADALSDADRVFVLDVYGAREQPIAGVSGAIIADHVDAEVTYLPDFSAVAEQVANAVRRGDVVVTMGAGDVTMLGPEIVEAIAARANRSAPQRNPGSDAR
jgi:UDP-N-acetylmuramate--alanine ligase